MKLLKNKKKPMPLEVKTPEVSGVTQPVSGGPTLALSRIIKSVQNSGSSRTVLATSFQIKNKKVKHHSKKLTNITNIKVSEK